MTYIQYDAIELTAATKHGQPPEGSFTQANDEC